MKGRDFSIAVSVKACSPWKNSNMKATSMSEAFE